MRVGTTPRETGDNVRKEKRVEGFGSAEGRRVGRGGKIEDHVSSFVEQSFKAPVDAWF